MTPRQRRDEAAANSSVGRLEPAPVSADPPSPTPAGRRGPGTPEETRKKERRDGRRRRRAADTPEECKHKSKHKSGPTEAVLSMRQIQSAEREVGKTGIK